MYKYALTVKEQLHLTSGGMIEVTKPQFADLNQAESFEVTQIDQLQEYMSQNEREIIAKQRDYMERGPGKIEAILNGEMAKLYQRMDEQIKLQDEEFMTKVQPVKR